MYGKIIKLVDDIAPEMIAKRRDFHKYPEIAWTEMRTASLIARNLADLGYEVLIGKRFAMLNHVQAYHLMRYWKRLMNVQYLKVPTPNM